MKLSEIKNTSVLEQAAEQGVVVKTKQVPKENIELLALCKWLSSEYPDVIFSVEQIGMKLPKQVAIRHSQMRTPKYPDIFIAEPVNGYCGIYIEFKATGVTIVNKSGRYIDEHVRGQAVIINRLIKKGYYACFSIGLEPTKELLTKLLNKHEKTENKQ